MVDPVELEVRVRRLARMIDAPEDLIPSFGWSRDAGYPFVEVSGETMHWVVRERGLELQRRTTADLEELLYWVFEAVTFSMATGWELRHRIESEDFRRALFAKQLKLLGKLRESWVGRRRAELGSLLDEVGLA